MLRPGEGLASTNEENSANFSAEKSTVRHSLVTTDFLTIREKTYIKSRTCNRFYWLKVSHHIISQWEANPQQP